MPSAVELNALSARQLGWGIKTPPDYTCFTGPDDPRLVEAVMRFQTDPKLMPGRQGPPTGVITQAELDAMFAIETAWVEQGTPMHTLGEMIHRCIQFPSRTTYKTPPIVGEIAAEQQRASWMKIGGFLLGASLLGYGVYKIGGKIVGGPRPNEGAPGEEDEEDEDEPDNAQGSGGFFKDNFFEEDPDDQDDLDEDADADADEEDEDGGED